MGLRIGFDATAAVHQAAGIGRYTRSLLEALAGRAGDDRFRIYYCGPGRSAGSLPALDGRFSTRIVPASDRIMNAVWHRLRVPLPVQLITGQIDVLHSPDFTLPPAPGTPTILTVHDLAFLTMPECAVPSLRRYLERVVPRCAGRATHVIAVSESTRRDVIALLNVPPERVTTILEAAATRFRPPDDEAAARVRVSAMGVDGPYVLSVGTLEPRKNYARLFEAWSLLRDRGVMHRLVVAGNIGWLYEPAMERLKDLHLGPHVIFLQPDDARLADLYGCADAFVYPSLYEGFGIPPLEAMACGAPVACSDSSSLPEVVGDAGLLFDPTDPDAIAGAILSILQDTALSERLREAGPARAAVFSWDRAAEETVRVYHEAAGA